MIIDTSSRTTPHLACLRQRGIDTIIRYYCSGNSSKKLQRDEAEAIIAAGMSIGVVYQNTATSAAFFSAALGTQHGTEAAQYARDVIRQPPGSTIFFAVDYDASAADVRDRIIPYFGAVQQAFATQGARYRVGAYGSGAVCQALLDARLISQAWLSQSSGFRGTRDFLQSGRWTLHQKLSSTLCVLSVDPNILNPNATGFGEFHFLGDRPVGSVPQPQAQPQASGALAMGARGAQVEALQGRLKALNYPVGTVDGIFGNFTRDALSDFQTDNNLPATGIADAATWTALNAGNPRPVSADRASTTSGDLAALGSTTILQAKRTKLIGWISSLFGALGLGSGAITGAVNGFAPGAAVVPPTPAAGPVIGQMPNLQQFVANIDQILPLLTKTPISVSPDLLTKATDATHQLQTAIPTLIQSIAALKPFIPPDFLNQNPAIAQLLNQVSSTVAPAVSQPAPLNTAFDILPHITSNPTGEAVLNLIGQAAGSFVPGIGGSLLALAIGIAANQFGNKIIQARTNDHRTGANTSR